MKLVLINSPREIPQAPDFPPLGLAYVCAAASQAGHAVRILDAAEWAWDKLAQEVAREAPDVVGITCWTIERGQAFRAARVAKEFAPNAIVIMGGPHATAFPRHMFIQAPVDYVVLGEGEQTICQLLEAVENGQDVSSIKGIAYKRDGAFFATERREYIEDLNSIPLIMHGQFDYGKYNGLHDTERKAAAIITSRGCPFRCAFCSSAVYWGCKYRARSIENVMSEVELLYDKFGIRALLFFDDNLVIDRERCISLCKALCEKKLDLVWAAEGSVRVDPEMLAWMKRAGCYRIDFGVESGSPTILKNIRKPFRVQDTRDAFRLCKEAGIKPNAYLIFGSPGETSQTIAETVALMREIQPDVGRGRPGVWILPDTEIYELSKKQRIVSDETWLTTDKPLYYTAEHSEEELRALERQFYIGMIRGRKHAAYAAEMLKDMLPRPVFNFLRGIKRRISGIRSLKI